MGGPQMCGRPDELGQEEIGKAVEGPSQTAGACCCPRRTRLRRRWAERLLPLGLLLQSCAGFMAVDLVGRWDTRCATSLRAQVSGGGARKASRVARAPANATGLGVVAPPLDLTGFRNGLDESYKWKRKCATEVEDRKPWGYWKDRGQILASVQEFWSALNVSSTTIPNEMLLRLYECHGLRHAIYKHGGRETLAYLLNTSYIPGNFRLAVQYPEVQTLLASGIIVQHNETEWNELDPAIQHRLVLGPRGGAILVSEKHKGQRYPQNYKTPLGQSWRNASRTAWTLDKVREECYALAEEHSQAMQVPPLFFPKISDLVIWRRANMIAAIRRLGGYDFVVQKLGFIPYNQWNYFCRFYLLTKELRDYLDKEQGGRREMPTLRAIKKAGYERLLTEISRNGGRKLVAARLGLPLKPNTGEGGEFLQMVNYGPFDFEFAIELFEYIMAKCWSQHPAERARLREDAKANLFLPTPQEMMVDQRKDLLEKIVTYGGFECVARRLQLGFKS